MARKNKILIISILILVLLLTGSQKIKKDVVESNAQVYEESEENESTMDTVVQETTTYSQEEIIKEAKQNIIPRLTVVDDELKSYGSSSTVSDFVDWFEKTYGSDKILKLNDLVKNNQYNNNSFYVNIGKSIYVLVDEFAGMSDSENIIYRETQNKSFVDVLFAGDLCLEEDGFVLDHYDETENIQDCISQSIITMTNNADIFMLNHEYCISDRGEALSGKYYTFRANPDRMYILKQLGVDIVSLANNHIYDYGLDAFTDTLKYLKDANIQYVGGGMNSDEAQQPKFYVVNGIKIGFVSASRAEKTIYTPEATPDSAGIVRMYDTTKINDIIANASKQCDYLIAYIHWGTEDSNKYETYQHDIAKQMFDSGADIIVGGHPHVLQGMEYIDGKPVIYSMGDFWFNGETKYTGMLNLKLTMEGLKEMSFIPCIQSNFSTEYVENNDEKKEIFDYLADLSYNITINENGIITNN